MAKRQFRWVVPDRMGLFVDDVLIVECARQKEGNNRSIWHVFGPMPDQYVHDPAFLPPTVKHYVVFGQKKAQVIAHELADLIEIRP